MKILIPMLLLLAAKNSMAFVRSNNSWPEILTAKNIAFLFKENLGGLDLRNACLTTSEIKPVEYCPKLVPVKASENINTYTNWVCEKWVVGTFSYPRAMTLTAIVAERIKVRVVQTHGGYST